METVITDDGARLWAARSGPGAGPWTTDRFTADLDAVRRHFGLERMMMLGHSWGAQLALSYALSRPERVSVLVYVSGTGIVPTTDWHDDYERGLLARLGEHPERLARRRESPRENRERAVLQWSVEFQDRERPWCMPGGWRIPGSVSPSSAAAH